MTKTKRQLSGASIAAAAFLIALTSLFILCSAAATEKYAAETGVPCAQCHQYPTGDARLTPFGKAFVAPCQGYIAGQNAALERSS